MQIHATNIHGLGASQVVKSFIAAYIKKYGKSNVKLLLSHNSLVPEENSSDLKFSIYKRYIHNGLSRFIECLFSRFLFKNIPTIVLGDIPLRGIKDQVVLVHQLNLIYPKINGMSGRSLSFRVSRFLFSINHKYAKKIIVQTSAMAEQLIESYPEIKEKVEVSYQPVPSWFKSSENLKRPISTKLKFFYPSAFYPHKKHDFLLKFNKYCISNNIDLQNFEILLTLTDEEFDPFKAIKWIKNLGRLDTEQMNHYYKNVDSLLFLSSMESYGLPLVEALHLNLPILSIDLPYSRALCEDKAIYFRCYDEKSFLRAIETMSDRINSQENYPNYKGVLDKFPTSWDIVVKVFTDALK